ncbi:hypothetical protein JR316_0010429 [Psilocybe cubensis]|uniref:Uncharacterized protein n=1 Tax=Psilocybe cubensis TaxID=181762 RepID=A0ACB8GM96_PSICU|nr:hypothetical protein JR316_0010429 [Psilocybe cubensis]KAH9476517.1 hypothetical protein JR316_0010429 [Psilocybe cubensis]
MANPEQSQVIFHDYLHLLPEYGVYEINFTNDLLNFVRIHASVNKHRDNVQRLSMLLTKSDVQGSLTSLHWGCFALDELPSTTNFGLFQVLRRITVELSLFEKDYSSDVFLLLPASLHHSGTSNWEVENIKMILNVRWHRWSANVLPVNFNNVDYLGMKYSIDRLRPLYPQLRKFKFCLCVEAQPDSYDIYSSRLEGVRTKLMETFSLDVPLAVSGGSPTMYTSVQLEIETRVEVKSTQTTQQTASGVIRHH